MIEKDYLKRQIDLFLQELVKLLSKNPSKEEKNKELSFLCEKYTKKPLQLFITSPFETIISEFKDKEEQLDLISELLFEFGVENSEEIIEKSQKIRAYLNQKGIYFPFRRNQNHLK